MKYPQPQPSVTPGPATNIKQATTTDKQPFTPPKLTFVSPTLTKHGRIETVTGLLGTFS